MARARHAPEEHESAGVIAARILAALAGNWVFTNGLASLLAVLLARAGMLRSEATVLAQMLAFPLFLVVLIIGFHTRRLARFAGIVIVGGAVTYGLARTLAGAM